MNVFKALLPHIQSYTDSDASRSSQIAIAKQQRDSLAHFVKHATKKLQAVHNGIRNQRLHKKRRQKILQEQFIINSEIDARIKEMSKGRHDKNASKFYNVLETDTPFQDCIIPYPPPTIPDIVQTLNDTPDKSKELSSIKNRYCHAFCSYADLSNNNNNK